MSGRIVQKFICLSLAIVLLVEAQFPPNGFGQFGDWFGLGPPPPPGPGGWPPPPPPREGFRGPPPNGQRPPPMNNGGIGGPQMNGGFGNGPMGGGGPMGPGDGDPRCRPDANSPQLPECMQKYFKIGVLIDGNSGTCHEKSVIPAKLDVDTLLNKAQKLMQSNSCQGERRPMGQRPFARNTRQQTMCGYGPGVGKCETNTQRLQSIYAERDMGDSILIVTNGVPNHCYRDGMDQPIPNYVCEHYRALLVPKKPQKTDSFKTYPMGIVGVAKSGAFFYNHMSAERSCNVAAITEKATFDTCDGHPDPFCHYHYHKAPVCIPGFDQCGLLGYQSDGFPVHGKCTTVINGVQVSMKSCYRKITGKNGCDASHYVYDRTTEGCNLDEANGFYFSSTTTTSSGRVFEAGTYAYFFTPEYPFIMPGYFGDTSQVRWCVVDV